MGFVILIIIIVAILIFLVKSSEDRQREKEVHQKYLESQEAFENSIAQCKEECDIDLSDPEEEFHDWCRAYSADVIGYNIAGINFRHLDYSHIGEFDGTIRIEEGNPYDENAVAIYRGRKKVGYIPRDHSAEIHQLLENSGGSASCSGFIYYFIDEELRERFAGKIIIGPSESADSESFDGK